MDNTDDGDTFSSDDDDDDDGLIVVVKDGVPVSITLQAYKALHKTTSSSQTGALNDNHAAEVANTTNSDYNNATQQDTAAAAPSNIPIANIVPLINTQVLEKNLSLSTPTSSSSALEKEYDGSYQTETRCKTKSSNKKVGEVLPNRVHNDKQAAVTTNRSSITKVNNVLPASANQRPQSPKQSTSQSSLSQNNSSETSQMSDYMQDINADIFGDILITLFRFKKCRSHDVPTLSAHLKMIIDHINQCLVSSENLDSSASYIRQMIFDDVYFEAIMNSSPPADSNGEITKQFFIKCLRYAATSYCCESKLVMMKDFIDITNKLNSNLKVPIRLEETNLIINAMQVSSSGNLTKNSLAAFFVHIIDKNIIEIVKDKKEKLPESKDDVKDEVKCTFAVALVSSAEIPIMIEDSDEETNVNAKVEDKTIKSESLDSPLTTKQVSIAKNEPTDNDRNQVIKFETILGFYEGEVIEVDSDDSLTLEVEDEEKLDLSGVAENVKESLSCDRDKIRLRADFKHHMQEVQKRLEAFETDSLPDIDSIDDNVEVISEIDYGLSVVSAFFPSVKDENASLSSDNEIDDNKNTDRYDADDECNKKVRPNDDSFNLNMQSDTDWKINNYLSDVQKHSENPEKHFLDKRLPDECRLNIEEVNDNASPDEGNDEIDVEMLSPDDLSDVQIYSEMNPEKPDECRPNIEEVNDNASPDEGNDEIDVEMLSPSDESSLNKGSEIPDETSVVVGDHASKNINNDANGVNISCSNVNQSLNKLNISPDEVHVIAEEISDKASEHVLNNDTTILEKDKELNKDSQSYKQASCKQHLMTSSEVVGDNLSGAKCNVEVPVFKIEDNESHNENKLFISDDIKSSPPRCSSPIDIDLSPILISSSGSDDDCIIQEPPTIAKVKKELRPSNLETVASSLVPLKTETVPLKTETEKVNILSITTDTGKSCDLVPPADAVILDPPDAFDRNSLHSAILSENLASNQEPSYASISNDGDVETVALSTDPLVNMRNPQKNIHFKPYQPGHSFDFSVYQSYSLETEIIKDGLLVSDALLHKIRAIDEDYRSAQNMWDILMSLRANLKDLPNEDQQTVIRFHPHCLPGKRLTNIIECKTCEYSFISIRSLEQHWKDTENNHYIYCKFCKGHFKNQETCLSNIRNHLLQEIDFLCKSRKFECELCKARFPTKCSLALHENEHFIVKHTKYVAKTKTPPVKIKCDFCVRNFGSLSKLRAHAERHKNQMFRNKCQICSTDFQISQDLELHSAIHSNTVPLKCEYCQKRFLAKYSLQKHKLSCTGKRHECVFCGLKFKSRKNFIFHISNHYAAQKVQDIDCFRCKKSFKSKRCFLNHLYSQHFQKNYICSKCSYCSTSARSFYRHLKSHMKLCPDCSYPINSEYHKCYVVWDEEDPSDEKNDDSINDYEKNDDSINDYEKNDDSFNDETPLVKSSNRSVEVDNNVGLRICVSGNAEDETSTADAELKLDYALDEVMMEDVNQPNEIESSGLLIPDTRNASYKDATVERTIDSTSSDNSYNSEDDIIEGESKIKEKETDNDKNDLRTILKNKRKADDDAFYQIASDNETVYQTETTTITLLVENISESIKSYPDLERVFGKYGRIVISQIECDTQNSRFAYIGFIKKEDGLLAIKKLNNKVLKCKRIRVTEYIKKGDIPDSMTKGDSNEDTSKIGSEKSRECATERSVVIQQTVKNKEKVSKQQSRRKRLDDEMSKTEELLTKMRKRTIVIEGIPEDSSYDSVLSTFVKFGKIEFLNIPSRDDSDEIKGIARIRYADDSAVESVLKDPPKVGNSKVKIERYVEDKSKEDKGKSKENKPQSDVLADRNRVTVRVVQPGKVTKAMTQKFKDLGKVLEIKVVERQNFFFIEYSNKGGLLRALSFNGKIFDKTQVSVSVDHSFSDEEAANLLKKVYGGIKPGFLIVFVSRNLSTYELKSYSWQLYDEFQQYGWIMEWTWNDRESCIYISYMDFKSAVNAWKGLDGKQLKFTKVFVDPNKQFHSLREFRNYHDQNLADDRKSSSSTIDHHHRVRKDKKIISSTTSDKSSQVKGKAPAAKESAERINTDDLQRKTIDHDQSDFELSEPEVSIEEPKDDDLEQAEDDIQKDDRATEVVCTVEEVSNEKGATVITNQIEIQPKPTVSSPTRNHSGILRWDTSSSDENKSDENWKRKSRVNVRSSEKDKQREDVKKISHKGKSLNEPTESTAAPTLTKMQIDQLFSTQNYVSLCKDWHIIVQSTNGEMTGKTMSSFLTQFASKICCTCISNADRFFVKYYDRKSAAKLLSFNGQSIDGVQLAVYMDSLCTGKDKSSTLQLVPMEYRPGSIVVKTFKKYSKIDDSVFVEKFAKFGFITKYNTSKTLHNLHRISISYMFMKDAFLAYQKMHCSFIGQDKLIVEPDQFYSAYKEFMRKTDDEGKAKAKNMKNDVLVEEKKAANDKDSDDINSSGVAIEEEKKASDDKYINDNKSSCVATKLDIADTIRNIAVAAKDLQENINREFNHVPVKDLNVVPRPKKELITVVIKPVYGLCKEILYRAFDSAVFLTKSVCQRFFMATYSDEQSVQKALSLNGTSVNGLKCAVHLNQWYDHKYDILKFVSLDRRPGSIFIWPVFRSATSESDVLKKFGRFGNILYHTNGAGIAVITYMLFSDAVNAYKEMNGVFFNGKKIKVTPNISYHAVTEFMNFVIEGECELGLKHTIQSVCAHVTSIGGQVTEKMVEAFFGTGCSIHDSSMFQFSVTCSNEESLLKVLKFNGNYFESSQIAVYIDKVSCEHMQAIFKKVPLENMPGYIVVSPVYSVTSSKILIALQRHGFISGWYLSSGCLFVSFMLIKDAYTAYIALNDTYIGSQNRYLGSSKLEIRPNTTFYRMETFKELARQQKALMSNPGWDEQKINEGRSDSIFPKKNALPKQSNDELINYKNSPKERKHQDDEQKINEGRSDSISPKKKQALPKQSNDELIKHNNSPKERKRQNDSDKRGNPKKKSLPKEIDEEISKVKIKIPKEIHAGTKDESEKLNRTGLSNSIISKMIVYIFPDGEVTERLIDKFAGTLVKKDNTYFSVRFRNEKELLDVLELNGCLVCGIKVAVNFGNRPPDKVTAAIYKLVPFFRVPGFVCVEPCITSYAVTELALIDLGPSIAKLLGVFGWVKLYRGPRSFYAIFRHIKDAVKAYTAINDNIIGPCQMKISPIECYYTAEEFIRFGNLQQKLHDLVRQKESTQKSMSGIKRTSIEKLLPMHPKRAKLLPPEISSAIQITKPLTSKPPKKMKVQSNLIQISTLTDDALGSLRSPELQKSPPNCSIVTKDNEVSRNELTDTKEGEINAPSTLSLTSSVQADALLPPLHSSSHALDVTLHGPSGDQQHIQEHYNIRTNERCLVLKAINGKLTDAIINSLKMDDNSKIRVQHVHKFLSKGFIIFQFHGHEVLDCMATVLCFNGRTIDGTKLGIAPLTDVLTLEQMTSMINLVPFKNRPCNVLVKANQAIFADYLHINIVRQYGFIINAYAFEPSILCVWYSSLEEAARAYIALHNTYYINGALLQVVPMLIQHVDFMNAVEKERISIMATCRDLLVRNVAPNLNLPTNNRQETTEMSKDFLQRSSIEGVRFTGTENRLAMSVEEAHIIDRVGSNYQSKELHSAKKAHCEASTAGNTENDPMIIEDTEQSENVEGMLDALDNMGTLYANSAESEMCEIPMTEQSSCSVAHKSPICEMNEEKIGQNNTSNNPSQQLQKKRFGYDCFSVTCTCPMKGRFLLVRVFHTSKYDSVIAKFRDIGSSNRVNVIEDREKEVFLIDFDAEDSMIKALNLNGNFEQNSCLVGVCPYEESFNNEEKWILLSEVPISLRPGTIVVKACTDTCCINKLVNRFRQYGIITYVSPSNSSSITITYLKMKNAHQAFINLNNTIIHDNLIKVTAMYLPYGSVPVSKISNQRVHITCNKFPAQINAEFLEEAELNIKVASDGKFLIVRCFDCSEEVLKLVSEHFHRIGFVSRLDKVFGKGYFTIEYSQSESVVKAMSLNGKKIHGVLVGVVPHPDCFTDDEMKLLLKQVPCKPGPLSIRATRRIFTESLYLNVFKAHGRIMYIDSPTPNLLKVIYMTMTEAAKAFRLLTKTKLADGALIIVEYPKYVDTKDHATALYSHHKPTYVLNDSQITVRCPDSGDFIVIKGINELNDDISEDVIHYFKKIGRCEIKKTAQNICFIKYHKNESILRALSLNGKDIDKVRVCVFPDRDSYTSQEKEDFYDDMPMDVRPGSIIVSSTSCLFKNTLHLHRFKEVGCVIDAYASSTCRKAFITFLNITDAARALSELNNSMIDNVCVTVTPNEAYHSAEIFQEAVDKLDEIDDVIDETDPKVVIIPTASESVSQGEAPSTILASIKGNVTTPSSCLLQGEGPTSSSSLIQEKVLATSSTLIQGKVTTPSLCLIRGDAPNTSAIQGNVLATSSPPIQTKFTAASSSLIQGEASTTSSTLTRGELGTDTSQPLKSSINNTDRDKDKSSYLTLKNKQGNRVRMTGEQFEEWKKRKEAKKLPEGTEDGTSADKQQIVRSQGATSQSTNTTSHDPKKKPVSKVAPRIRHDENEKLKLSMNFDELLNEVRRMVGVSLAGRIYETPSVQESNRSSSETPLRYRGHYSNDKQIFITNVPDWNDERIVFEFQKFGKLQSHKYIVGCADGQQNVLLQIVYEKADSAQNAVYTMNRKTYNENGQVYSVECLSAEQYYNIGDVEDLEISSESAMQRLRSKRSISSDSNSSRRKKQKKISRENMEEGEIVDDDDDDN